MKKQYQKPVLYAETFALVEHIARCAPPNAEYDRANYGDINSCGFNIGAPGSGMTLFGNDNCALAPFLTDYSMQGAKDAGFQCYNSFFDMAASYTMFSS